MLEICWAFASSIFESQQHLAGSSAQFSSSGTSGPYVLVLGSTCICLALCMNPFHITPLPPSTHTNTPWRPKADLIPGLRLQKQTQNRTLEIIRKMEMEMKTFCRLKVMIIFFFRLHIQYQYWTLIVHFQFNQSWHFATLISVHICILYHHHIYTIYTWQTALRVASFKSHKIQLNNVRRKKLKRERKKEKKLRGKIVLAARAGK